jgi:hypothetical protein
LFSYFVLVGGSIHLGLRACALGFGETATR